MVLFTDIFIFACAGVFWFMSNILLDEVKYRAFLLKYTQYFGIDMTKIPPTQAIPDPIMPMVKQGKLVGYIFRIAAIGILVVGIFLIRFI